MDTALYQAIRTGPLADQNADRLVPLIGAISIPYHSKSAGNGQEEEKGEPKVRCGSQSLRSCDPLHAGDFFSSCGEKKRLPVWGEGTRR
ncbi:hypothetical protein BHE74_00031625, partial [Ensete ventricosum]